MPPIYTYGPCYKGISQKKVIIFTKNSDCICVPFVYKLMKQCRKLKVLCYCIFDYHQNLINIVVIKYKKVSSQDQNILMYL